LLLWDQSRKLNLKHINHFIIDEQLFVCNAKSNILIYLHPCKEKSHKRLNLIQYCGWHNFHITLKSFKQGWIHASTMIQRNKSDHAANHLFQNWCKAPMEQFTSCILENRILTCIFHWRWQDYSITAKLLWKGKTLGLVNQWKPHQKTVFSKLIHLFSKESTDHPDICIPSALLNQVIPIHYLTLSHARALRIAQTIALQFWNVKVWQMAPKVIHLGVVPEEHEFWERF